MKMKKDHVQRLLDNLKDEIDELTQIQDAAQRKEAARELIEYLELHYTNGR